MSGNHVDRSSRPKVGWGRRLRRWVAPPAFRSQGVDYFAKHAWLMETMDWPAEKRLRWRLDRLGNILEFCWEHVPFYREFWGDHGWTFHRPRALEELEAIPALDKDVFRANIDRVRPDNLEAIAHKRNSSGGTTGVPIVYHMDLELWTQGQAFHLWGWGQAGYRFGDPIGVIAGSSLVPAKPNFKARMRYALENKLALSGVHLDKDLAREYHGRLQAHGAEFLYGYPSVLSVFACLLDEQGLRLPSLKGAITTAEMLLPQYRKNIEERLGCPVWDHLGCNDGGFLSYECARHDGFHYNDLLSILETDRTQSDGSGRLLATSLWNRSTPFIRYENGDLAKLGDASCPCGSPFPMIESIEGRTMDLLTFKNGRTLSGPALTLIFRDMPIDGWQVVQLSPGSLEVRLLAREGPREKDMAYIRDVFAHHLGPEIKLNVRRVSEMKTTASGKLKPVWSEVA